MSIAKRNRATLPFSLITQSFEEAVEGAAFISLHIPATPENYSYLHAEQPHANVQDPGVMNLSRGVVVDEGNRFDALTSGSIADAALDEFFRDPFASQTGKDLRQLPNLLLTPHLDRTLPKPAMRRHARHSQETILSALNTLSTAELFGTAPLAQRHTSHPPGARRETSRKEPAAKPGRLSR